MCRLQSQCNKFNVFATAWCFCCSKIISNYIITFISHPLFCCFLTSWSFAVEILPNMFNSCGPKALTPQSNLSFNTENENAVCHHLKWPLLVGWKNKWSAHDKKQTVIKHRDLVGCGLGVCRCHFDVWFGLSLSIYSVCTCVISNLAWLKLHCYQLNYLSNVEWPHLTLTLTITQT